MPTIHIDPITRVEGHLALTVTLDATNKVTSAQLAGTMYRDFENILVGRHPFDPVAITQRICGVCPVSHSIAAAKAAESALGFKAGAQAQLLRALVQGGNFVQDHILHFYHLSLLDYITGPQMPPWTPTSTRDVRITGAKAQALTDHYVQALHIRRKAQEMVAIIAGKVPHVASITPGGVTARLTTTQIAQFKTYLTEVRNFVTNVYLPDVEIVAAAYPDYLTKGRGPGNLLSYGVFDMPNGTQLLKRGRLQGATAGVVDRAQIAEHVKSSFYSSTSQLNPALGSTVPAPGKLGAYSWLKAPRYGGLAYEAGALARMKVNGDYTGGISVIDRMRARALEAKKIADAMVGWIAQITANTSAFTKLTPSASGTAVALTEAPRGALAHWTSHASGLLTRYQIVTPTCWNASPRDDAGRPGPIEQALIGTVVADPTQPIELLRIIRSFDPCTGCAVHVVQPEKGVESRFVVGMGA